MRVAKWGDSLAIRLPSIVVEALDLKVGDDVEIHVSDERALGIEKSSVQDLLGRLRQYRGQLPADFRFDRLEAQERG